MEEEEEEKGGRLCILRFPETQPLHYRDSAAPTDGDGGGRAAVSSDATCPQRAFKVK